HPFFAQSGSIQCIRSLISEVNAEQITTEVVVGSDDEALYDDDDDTATVSSMTTISEAQPYDASSVSSKQKRNSVLSATEQKIPPQVTTFTSKPTLVNAGSTTVVELEPTTQISPVCIENNVANANLLSSLLSGKKQRAPSLPEGGGNLEEKNMVAIVEINADGQDKPRFLERPSSAGSCKSSGHGHHHAAVIALSDLDKALNLEEELFCENREDDDLSPVPTLSPTPDFLPSECFDPAVPILSASEAAFSVSSKVENSTEPSLIVLSKDEMNDDTIGIEFKLDGRKPAHQICDIVSDKQLNVHLLGRPTTVQITDTGAVLTTSNVSLGKKSVETNAQVKLERPNVVQEANFVHTLKVEDSQQLEVKAFKKDEVTLPELIRAEEFRSSEQQDDIGNESSNSTAAQRCLSQPQVVSSSKVTLEGARSRHLIQVGATSTAIGANQPVGKLPLGVSLSTDQLNTSATRTIYTHIPDSVLQSSPLLENKQLLKHQHSMRPGFIVPKAEIKIQTGMTQPSIPSDKTAASSTDEKGTEKTIIEIRRPLSYPESNNKQVRTRKAVTVSSRAGSSPPWPTQLLSRHSAVATKAVDHAQWQGQNWNLIRDQNQNRKRLIAERSQGQNKMILKNITGQKTDKTGDQNGVVPGHYQLTPTTSNKRKEMHL
ncbi:hypothetical protein WUBG_07379, partial [Wuchereria bancrofti]